MVRKFARQKDKTADAPLPGPGSKLGKMDPYEEGTMLVLNG